MNRWLELLFGLVLLIGTILVASFWFPQAWGIPAWNFFKGGLIWFVGLLGMLFIMLGISDMKD
jgi:predicted phage tail protein